MISCFERGFKTDYTDYADFLNLLAAPRFKCNPLNSYKK